MATTATRTTSTRRNPVVHYEIPPTPNNNNNNTTDNPSNPTNIKTHSITTTTTTTTITHKTVQKPIERTANKPLDKILTSTSSNNDPRNIGLMQPPISNSLLLSASPTDTRLRFNYRSRNADSDLQESTEEDGEGDEDEEDEDEDELDWRRDPNSNEHYNRFGDMENEAILHYGYLDKKGERRKTWKSRWFVLRRTTLVYYKNEKEYRLLRMVPLTDIHTCAEVQFKRHDNTFGIVTSNRTYYVRAKTRTERDQWTQKVTQAKDQLKVLSERSRATSKSRSGDDHLLSNHQPNPGILRSHTLIENRAAAGPSKASPLDQNPVTLNDEPQGGPRVGLTHRDFASNSRSMNNPSSVVSPDGISSSGVSDNQYQQATITKSFMQTMKGSLKPDSTSSEYHSTPLGALADLSSTGSSVGLQDHHSNPSNQPQNVQGPLISSSEEDDEVEDEQNRVAVPIPGSPQATKQERSQDQGLSKSNPSPQTTGERKLSLPEAGKTIIQGYLMKLGKRRNWRKRYFLLTSQTLVYSKSHMNMSQKSSRSIPVARILDAIECCLTDPSSSGSQSHQPQEHCFKIITSERTYLVNAPTEEDEIKWLSAIRCLLASYRANLPKPFGAILDQPLLNVNHHSED